MIADGSYLSARQSGLQPLDERFHASMRQENFLRKTHARGSVNLLGGGERVIIIALDSLNVAPDNPVLPMPFFKKGEGIDRFEIGMPHPDAPIVQSFHQFPFAHSQALLIEPDDHLSVSRRSLTVAGKDEVHAVNV